MENSEKLTPDQDLLKVREEQLVRYTEYNLATLEELQDLKGTAKHRIERQTKICQEMVLACRSFCHSETPWVQSYGRVKKALVKYGVPPSQWVI